MSEFFTGYAAFHWVETWSNPVLDALFRVITDLGSPIIYFFVIAPLFWVIDRRRALVLFALVLISGLINAEVKILANTARPDPNLARVLDLRPIQSGNASFPSGHAQIAVAFWSYLAYWMRRRWFTGLALLAIAAISFSRIYLGAHFPIDVAGGLLLGAAALPLMPALDRWSEADFTAPLWTRFFLAACALALMLRAGDPTVVTISGCVLALVVLLSLPPVIIEPASGIQSAAVVGVGLAVQLLVALLLGQLSGSPVDWQTGFRVAAGWLVALWAYPYAVAGVFARRLLPEPPN